MSSASPAPGDDRIAAAMELAIDLAEQVRGRTSPNPPVGAVILDEYGALAGTGATRPPGGPHAEVMALRQAGPRARGGTAVVTLEPCNHHGRTGPCAEALLDAGVTAVHYAVADPNPQASGGADRLRACGLTVTAGVRAEQVASGPLRAWLHRVRTGRPQLTWKYAATLDGRSAAADGTSQWITGPVARERVHAERGRIDAIVVGTGTVLADDPALTARLPDGTLSATQPLRVVVGRRDIPPGARILDDSAPTVHLRTDDPHEVLAALAAEHCDVQLEGGPRLAAAFLRAGLVDRVQAYLAPVLIGAGQGAVGDLGIGTISAALRFHRESVDVLGEDILLTLVPDGPAADCQEDR
ncbi:bifunctional diaminohydroxyphosphoribosylaminopyrimidine deaminase/5-amino-6-(5-phosphoribosylamino)uracil reductase RibD [Rhodococcus sp. D2-41]|uniref:Riboflavin biosynthesis protein RibD n=1 Tax=Speluncibacter jeojiensis TaxID=2710754 RepID=A0A9X4REG8_9ACTN|nr:bifunctional diaminohydroxyphosphoribosylaminopyrimidine deaminase/5-amino-6-(5-phosphoribosylamino)uracil reductase RibD [Rhodococcus sp. D2-41]MDG3011243.1 bifunctional diaminohydroxyphosphoribosylaminopyrimidine deaminase/5-amino-6-(5-phosphoribosylamino)uracil reductase RibD [Rhodococcus sp. D2-41]MDG3015905.1 bifunctional diaminohydroxyphosphoribosylaminopyrimidine deaminase/5-amino-6-(5-phosphoribosylamino)uracil reductase RibD [Corynebacteriales bacterium D3-21]